MSFNSEVPMPAGIAALPRTDAGYPIPFFAATIGGKRDLRVITEEAILACSRRRNGPGLCWICGQPRAAVTSFGTPDDAFVIGAMCAINRVTQEPPSHVACAEYAVKVCPFLTRPDMTRRDRNLPGDIGFSGTAILRNSGVSLLWVTDDWYRFPVPTGMGEGKLFKLGDPVAWSWWAQGRPATRAEADEAIRSGLPLLQGEANRDEDPRYSHRLLRMQTRAALRYLPDDGPAAEHPGGLP